MPYTPLAALADGAVLSASHLNTITANADYLRGLADASNIPFQSHEFGGTGDKTWYFRKRCRYILYQFVISDDDADDITIRVNGVQLYHDGSPGVGTYTGSIDLSGEGLTDLAWYPVKFEYQKQDTSDCTLVYLAHSDSTSL